MPSVKDGVHYDVVNGWISIGNQIKNITAIQFEKALCKISRKKIKKPIIVFLDGKMGGDVYACIKIGELMENSQTPIFTIATNVVFSGFFYILQAGKKRFATPETKLIFHRVTQYYENVGMNASDMLEGAEALLLLDNMQLSLFFKRGRPLKKIFELFRKEARLTSAQALKFKLIDGIVPKSSLNKMRKYAK